MNNLDTSLLIIELKSIPLGYRILNTITTTLGESLRVLDASPVGGGFMIMALGDESTLTTALSTARSDLSSTGVDSIVDSEIVKHVDADVLEASHSILQTKLMESLLIVECESVSAMMSASNLLKTGHGLHPVEIKIGRAGRSGAHGFFTGNAKSCVSGSQDIQTRMRNAERNVSIEVIEEPSKHFKSYFEF